MEGLTKFPFPKKEEISKFKFEVYLQISGIIHNKHFNLILKTMEKIKIEQNGFTAFSWFAGWLFSIGFLGLSFKSAIFAILLWPYYIGVYVKALM